jgi:chromosomal replication initiation ATPase DnaA
MSRVDHWASVRDRSVAPKRKDMPTDSAIADVEALHQAIAEKDIVIERLCTELEARHLSSGPHAGHRIARAVAVAHGVSYNEMISHRRAKHLVRARQEAMWLLKKYTKLSLPLIGGILGNRDHTTIMYGVAAHQNRLADSNGN